MSTTILYHTQGIRDFKHVGYRFHDGIVEQTIERKEHRCTLCGSHHVSTYKRGTRIVTGLPIGSKGLWLKFDVHDLYCHDCGGRASEQFSFLSTPKSRITKLLERTVVEYHSCMSTLAIARHFGLRWHTIRGVQLRYLQKEYSHVSCKGVTAIGVDEIMVGHTPSGGQRYLTIVRDLHEGTVLWVGDGKGEEALKGFEKRLRKSKAKIEYVTMDLGHPFASWVKKNLPDATIIYDHFHVIKIMNEAVDKVRRRVMAQMEDTEKKSLKRQRYLFLRNASDLTPEAKAHLENIKGISADLGAMHTMKEDLRAIYSAVVTGSDAKMQLRQWISCAGMHEVPEMSQVAKCATRHLDGIVAFWDTRLTNSHMEGFNSKLRGMIKMANGYTDDEFFKLKIYDLPDQKIIEVSCEMSRRNELRRQIVYPNST